MNKEEKKRWRTCHSFLQNYFYELDYLPRYAMIKSYHPYRCLLLLLFIKIHFISGQICTNDIPDFFVC